MGDLVEPGACVLGLLERVVVLVRLDERVLGQVRGELRFTEHAQEVGVDLAVVLGEERLDEGRRPPRGPTCRSWPLLAIGAWRGCQAVREGQRERGRRPQVLRAGWETERGHRTAPFVGQKTTGLSPDVTHQPVPSTPRLGAPEQLLDGVLRRDRVDRAGRSPARGRRSRAGAGGSPSASGRSRRPVRAAAPCGGRGCTAGRRGWPRAARGPGGGPRRWRPRPASVARPKSASWRRGTIQTSNDEREAYGAKATLASSSQTSRSGGRDSSRTRRQNGHSPSRITKRAAPPISSAIRCGIWGRSYRSRHRWLVRAPAWAPQFWTTWR